MKVMCVNAGDQANDRPTVIVGNEYTVVDYVYGWELFHKMTSEVFYQLAEMPEGQVFWSGLFAQISENEFKNEAIIITQRQD